MARIFWLFLAGLLVGCDNNPADNGETGTVGPCEECDDSGVALVIFIGPPILFVEEEEACQTNLLSENGEKVKVQTGEEKEIFSGNYTATYGDPALASAATGGLPVHTLQNGWMAVSPAVTVAVAEETFTPDPPAMNLLPKKGEWTCDFNDGSNPVKGTVSSSGGNMVELPGVGTLTVTGTDLTRIGDDFEQYGAFASDAFATIINEGGMTGNYTADCWAGNPGEDPRTR